MIGKIPRFGKITRILPKNLKDLNDLSGFKDWKESNNTSNTKEIKDMKNWESVPKHQFIEVYDLDSKEMRAKVLSRH